MSHSDEWCIYTLSDPQSGAIRYVGFTSDLATRLKKHLGACTRKDRPRSHCVNWIRTIGQRGLKPICSVVETGSGPGWQEAEMRWIRHLKDAGCDLTNATQGGEGVRGAYVSEETRRKLSAAAKGRVHSEQARRNMSEGRRGKHPRPFSPEARRRMSEAQKRVNRTLTPERLAALKDGRKKYKPTPEYLEMLRESGQRLSDQFNHNRPHCTCENCRNCTRRRRRAKCGRRD